MTFGDRRIAPSADDFGDVEAMRSSYVLAPYLGGPVGLERLRDGDCILIVRGFERNGAAYTSAVGRKTKVIVHRGLLEG
jgi:hypothetical protein